MIASVQVVESLDDAYGGPAKSVPSLFASMCSLGGDGVLVSVDSNLVASNSVVDLKQLRWVKSEPSGLKAIRYSRDLKTLLRESMIQFPGVVHIHSLWTYPTYAAYSVARSLKRPIVLSARSNLYSASLSRSRFKKGLAEAIFVDSFLRDVACIHATSEEEAAEVLKLGLKVPVVVVPNGVDTSEFDQLPAKDVARMHLGLGVDRCYLLFFSRVHPRKGLDRLVRAWLAVADRFPDVDLVVAGPVDDEGYSDSVKKLVANSNHGSRFHFLGMVSGERRLSVLAAADLFVLPTLFENFGMAVGEALACGLPVITTKGTPWDMLPQAKCGWWIDCDDKSTLSTLLEALQRRSEFGDMGKRGRELVSQQFAWKAQAKKMIEIYEWVLSTPRNGRAPYSLLNP